MEENLPYSRCIHCGQLQSLETRFCGSCGKAFVASKVKQTEKSVKYIIAFYVSFLVLAILIEYLRSEDDSFGTELAIEVIFALVSIGFCLLDWQNVFSTYRLPILNFKGIALALFVPIATAVTVFYGMDWLNMELFGETENMFAGYAYYENSLFWAILFVAITPPLFEELAFRGFLFGQLEKVTSTQVTIIATAFIFALVHFSFLSFLWIFPFGLFLGYLRSKYQTLWYGMIAHFIHNLIVLLLDYSEYLQYYYIE